MNTRKVYFLLILVLVTAVLAGCACEHEWAASTCLAPRTCVRCGEVQGKVRSHAYGNTSCNNPEPCTVCGTMEGIELTHEWQEDCKICIHCGKDERPADERFMENLIVGINTRWSLYWNEDSTLTKEDWEKCIHAEYDLLHSFREEKFQDKALGDAAHKYVRCLEDSLEAVKEFDPATWGDVYDANIFQEQCIALYHIHQARPFTVDEQHWPRFEYTVNQGEIINMIYPFFEEIFFLYVGEANNAKKYETFMENTTTLDFKEFIFEIDLYDAEGKLLDTVESTVYLWNSGAEKCFTFYSNKEFSSMKVGFARWKFND